MLFAFVGDLTFVGVVSRRGDNGASSCDREVTVKTPTFGERGLSEDVAVKTPIVGERGLSEEVLVGTLKAWGGCSSTGTPTILSGGSSLTTSGLTCPMLEISIPPEGSCEGKTRGLGSTGAGFVGITAVATWSLFP